MPSRSRTGAWTAAGYDSKFAALYWPWVEGLRPGTGNEQVHPAVSGHMAGIWARNDDTRGVHKAPANEVVRGAISLQTQITKAEHDLLNPIGINCIRAFPGRGIRVWGARTMSSDPTWRYLNVRRLFNYLEESILHGTQWVVFEPNDPALWARIRRTISAFLVNEWRKGALFGLTPDAGLLRQVRRRDQPGRGHRRRPGRLPGRRRPGEAGRVRHLPAIPVLRRHQPRQRVSHSSKGARPWPSAILTTHPPTPSRSRSTASRCRRVIEVSGLKTEVDKIELKQQTQDGKYVVRQLIGRPKAGELHGHARPDATARPSLTGSRSSWRATSPEPARRPPSRCSTTRARR